VDGGDVRGKEAEEVGWGSGCVGGCAADFRSLECWRWGEGKDEGEGKGKGKGVGVRKGKGKGECRGKGKGRGEGWGEGRCWGKGDGGWCPDASWERAMLAVDIKKKVEGTVSNGTNTRGSREVDRTGATLTS